MLTDAKLQAWFSFLQVHAVVTDALDRDLRARCGLPLGDYEVLLTLGRAAGGSLSMHDLAEDVLLSPSGTTRAVDRLEHQGLVVREPDAGDGRVTRASLTPSGRKRLRAAAPIHVEGVRERFLDALTARRAHDLRASMQAVLEANDRPERIL